MKILFIWLLIAMTHSYAQEFSFLHYNIKELDSLKILKNSEQVKAVKNILNRNNFDFLSLNEIHYDSPNIPNNLIKTQGQNLTQLIKLFELPHNYSSFHPALTGNNALKKEDGSYYSDPNSTEARNNADQINFGIMPAQYSTGLISKFKIFEEKLINIKWKDFNPSIDLSKFKLANGNPVPEDILLFDKTFSDITISINEKKLHLVLLHAVTAFGFGNKNTMNFARNADQLKFLEWYLTGKTSFEVSLSNINPLKENTHYLAAGDFNVDIKETQKEGARVLKNLINKTKSWLPLQNLTHTYESDSLAPDPFRLNLDYILVSKNIKVLEGKILHPNYHRIELGTEKPEVNLNKNQELISYLDNNKTNYAIVTKNYTNFKKASDHFPIWGRFQLLD